ncbi:DsbC family protein [Candidatus Methylospira mobilis]|uniref:Thiol:disulfide interchange protein n=1 Tax=Candidatus Methylospira mobilis TaxID=1808979 RepID=A0A5Q0BIE5_9GAMM|nr:DsbC family protein [Candidatus Methylospira mobilis]QFY41971.1 DsbC family protein [Candidatus Methylospira mobilis]WNV02960.1 DsbC family protein [Candidatus Methylospira mobilis]
MKKIILIVSVLLGGFSLLAGGAARADSSAVGTIEKSVVEALHGEKPDSIKPSPIHGLYEVTIGPKLFYVSDDGAFLIQGHIVDLKAKDDVTEPRQAAARIAALNKLGLDKMIVFKPKTTKHPIYVFTDIDCGYCRKLHSEIDQYLGVGIEVRYLFFPRAGEGSDSWQKAESVWCSKDRNAAMTKAKKGETTQAPPCKNPVAEQYKLGTDLGANGTPMIVTEKGSILPGYVPAAQLSKMLDEE